MSTPPRAVFDCNVFFQALIGERGPAAACLNRAEQGRIDLVCSSHILEEVRDLCTRPAIRDRFHITDSGLGSLLRLIRETATFHESPPSVYVVASDPDDSHYIDLAVAASASLVVSRDRDLLRLMDARQSEALEFRARFPHMVITDPPGMLRMLEEPRNR